MKKTTSKVNKKAGSTLKEDADKRLRESVQDMISSGMNHNEIAGILAVKRSDVQKIILGMEW